jgi:peptide-methionine (S)-S-oxide reductase
MELIVGNLDTCKQINEELLSKLEFIELQEDIWYYCIDTLKWSTYKTICNGDTGHAEGIKIIFDATLISFETLLEIFFVSHDPTTLNRQGNDVGTQYRSAIFCLNGQQREIAINMIAKLDQAQMFNSPIVTQINGGLDAPLDIFYPAETYHQYYFAKNPAQPYCLAVAAPKAAKVRAKYSQLIKVPV